jgi:hypothetical protein
MLTALRFVLRVVAEMDQGVVPLRRFHDHVTAPPAIAARRSPAGNKLLSPEGHAAVAAISCLHPDFCFIDKHQSLFRDPPTAGFIQKMPSSQFIKVLPGCRFALR